MVSAMAAKASRVEEVFRDPQTLNFRVGYVFMLFPLLSDQFVQSCFTVPTLWATQPQASVCGSLRHQQTVSIGFQFPLLVRSGISFFTPTTLPDCRRSV